MEQIPGREIPPASIELLQIVASNHQNPPVLLQNVYFNKTVPNFTIDVKLFACTFIFRVPQLVQSTFSSHGHFQQLWFSLHSSFAGAAHGHL